MSDKKNTIDWTNFYYSRTINQIKLIFLIKIKLPLCSKQNKFVLIQG